MKRLTADRRSHSHLVGGLRFGVGAWLLGLSVYLCYRGIWLGALLTVPAALHFYLAYRALHRSVES